ncbi:MAG: tetratricopeptide repeat protein [Candidatus Omnitrophota bacterium]|nr:MAG: tetratricopeptide repeat protein [Candidatus Omnitrophota bacterium]
MRRFCIFIISLILILLYSSNSFSGEQYAKNFAYVNFTKANSFYQQEKFKEAIKEYEKIIDAGFCSANIYYNLGNTYFKIGSIGKAILNYERARRLAPDDGDLLTNLEYAKSLIVDRSIRVSAPWFVEIISRLPERFSAGRLCQLLFTINISIFIILTINLFLSRPNRFFIFMTAVFLITFIAGSVVLSKKATTINKRQEAVVIVSEIDCRFGPLDNATVHFKLYEGSKIIILKTEADWSKIKRFDGKIGWIKKDSYEII